MGYKKDLNIFENALVDMAIHRILPDEHGKTVDSVILEVNEAFAKHMGLNAVDIVGNKFSEVIPGIKDTPLIETLKQVALTGEPARFEQYFTSLTKHFIIDVYGIDQETVVTVLQDITDHKKTENTLRKSGERLSKINDCLISLSTDYETNMDILTALSGELLGGTCAIYNRLNGDRLCSVGQWHTPPGYISEDKPQGHICYDVIKLGISEPFILRHLDETTYAKTDPNVRSYGLKTYIGYPVMCCNETVGSLCVVYQDDVDISEDDIQILGLLASAIGREEERNIVEEELHESFQKYEELSFIFNCSPACAFVWEMKDNWPVRYVSENVSNIFGYKANDFTSGSILFADIIHPDDLPRVTQEVQENLAAGMAEYKQEYRLIDKKGDTHWVDDRTWVRSDETGVPLFLQGILWDITDRKKAEKDLRETSNVLEAMLDQLQDAVAFQNPDLTIMRYNKAGYELLNISPEEVMGQKCYELIGRGEECKDCQTKKALKSRKIETADRYVPELDKYIRATSNPILDEDGEIIFIVEQLQDITEHKQAEEESIQREKLLNNIFDILPIGLWIADNNGRLLRGNPAGKRIWGAEPLVSSKEYGVFKAWKLPSGEEILPEDWALARTIKEGITVKDELLEIEAFDQKRRTILNYTAPVLNDGGEMLGAIIVNNDITELKKTEDELLKAKEAAEAANIAKSEFLANMSHEIRTPMNAIIGFTDLLLETEMNDAQRHYIDIVQRSGASLLNLIEDVLDLSKIDAGKLELEKLDFNLQDLLKDFVDTMSLRAHSKGIKLSYDLEEDVPLLLKGDPGRLTQILTNLTGNAIKFTTEGEVAIHISIESLQDDTVMLRFEVTDTGIGISEDTIDLIFEKFTQADASNTRRFGGSGLGLAISKQLAEMMDGQIGVISEVEKGSEFWFTVRLDKQSQTVEIANSENATLLQSGNHMLNLLLVEDDIYNQKVAQEMLMKLGFNVNAVNNGMEAIKALETRSYDLVLMDVQMPEMDGMEATRQIRSPESRVINRNIPIIALTAHAMQGDRERFIEAGMDDYLSKPITLKALRELLDRWK
ncbi:PAS domain S-box protein [Methanolobus sp. WCC5]|uniref:PAS domain S-box protein n=1 Tax=Methanolobus sp. WCC5 TaxID=3125785 RepID=UPI003247317A